MRRREAGLVGAAALAFVAFLVVMASWSVPQLDDWYELTWIDHHGFSLASALELARYNYMNYNPRLGEDLLLVIDGSAVLHCIVTPALQTMLLVVSFVLAHGAWPRATARDLGRLVLLQALIWLVIPIPGVMYFYRPYTANYLFATCVQLGLFATYRLELARPIATRRSWLVPAMLVWGVAGGLANEHTGPTAIVAAVAFAAWAWRWRRLRAWMVCGAIGLAVGYALLVLAPGQTVRYAGLTSGQHPFRTMLARGLDGNFKFVGDYLVEIAPGVVLVIAGALLAIARRGAAAAELSRASAIRIVLALAAAFAIVLTTFASPIVEDRVFFAPCMVTAIALAIAADVAWAETRARQLVIAAAALVIAIHAVGFIVGYRDVVARTEARVAALRAAGPHDVVTVAPEASWPRDHWQYGEDLQYAYMRELLAHRVFHVDALELAGAPAWAQPTPPETTHVELDFDRSAPPSGGAADRAQVPASDRPAPPSGGAADRAQVPASDRPAPPSGGAAGRAQVPASDRPSPLELAPLGSRPPAQWAWIVRELREAWSSLAAIGRLRAIDVTVTPATRLPGGRPIHIVTWRDDAFRFIDAHPRTDAQGWPFAGIDLGRTGLIPTEAWIDACGSVARADLVTVARELRVAMRYRCAGNHTIYVCDAAECWLAWRYW